MPWRPFFSAVLWWSIAAPVAYLLAVHVLVTARRAAASRGRRPDIEHEELAGLAVSRFTIPVSLIVNVAENGKGLAASVRSLLELDYPELEVIVVTDEAQTHVIETLKPVFGLVPRQMFYRRSLPGLDVRSLHTSALDSRLLVVDQPSLGEAAAWNCGVNLSRYRYVGIVPAGRFCRADALLDAMRPANGDPANVVAILGDLGSPDRRATERAVDGDAGGERGRRYAMSGFTDLQRLCGRIDHDPVSMDLGEMADHPDAFGLWRRDAVVQAGGFAADGAGAGLDLAARLRDTLESESESECRILTMARPRRVAHVETLRQAIESRARWCHAWLEAAWRTRGGAVVGGTRALAHTSVDVLPAVFEAWLLVALPAGVFTGAIGWPQAVAIAATVALARASATNGALLVAACGREPWLRRPLRSIAFAVLEFPAYRPVALAAALQGALRFLRARLATPRLDPA